MTLKTLAALWLLTLLLVSATASWAQMKVRVNWSATAGGQSGFWVAHEEGIFKKNGLEVELLHIPSSSRAIQTMLAGELAISYVDPRNTIEANFSGAPVALLAGVTNRFTFSLMARPEIKRVGDLKGRKIGVTRIGSSTHTASLYALNQAGLKPGDYQILPLFEVPNILTALMAGQIDAGLISPPTTFRGRKAGLNELVNLGREGPEFASVAVGSPRAYIKANEEIVRRVVRSYVEAIHRFKTNKEVGLKVLQKYTRVKEPGDPGGDLYRVPRLYRKHSVRKQEGHRDHPRTNGGKGAKGKTGQAGGFSGRAVLRRIGERRTFQEVMG